MRKGHSHRGRLLFIVVLPLLFGFTVSMAPAVTDPMMPTARHVILIIADGWGVNQIAAANAYSGDTPVYQTWPRNWISTYPAGGSYDPVQAWSNFAYVTTGSTDSAAAATALVTGVKTANGNISVNTTDDARLYSLADKARQMGKAIGAVTSVPMSHATPGAWMAHNSARANGYAIADEGYWGNPNTTGTITDSVRYGGGFGSSLPPLDVMIGGGHPDWSTNNYLNIAMRDKLLTENGQPGAFTFVQRIAGSLDGGPRLMAAAANTSVTRLAGLFGGSGGNLEYRLADGTGHQLENPTLAQMTTAALLTLNRAPNGFVLLLEGGAVDWGGHSNNMDRMLGEMLGFNEAVQVVIDWIEDPNNSSNWQNTLVIVTGDHETGYLTAGPSVFPNQPLGTVNSTTISLEKLVGPTGRRASWDDVNNNNLIDTGETVYWAWNSGSHTNSLIPLYAKGVGVDLFATSVAGVDPVRGAYLDNTTVHQVMTAVSVNNLSVTPTAQGKALQLDWQYPYDYTSFPIYHASTPYFLPTLTNQIAAPVVSSYLEGDVLGDPDNNHFYLVTAVHAASEMARSQRLGTFSFPLLPGMP